MTHVIIFIETYRFHLINWLGRGGQSIDLFAFCQNEWPCFSKQIIRGSTVVLKSLNASSKDWSLDRWATKFIVVDFAEYISQRIIGEKTQHSFSFKFTARRSMLSNCIVSRQNVK